MSHKDQCVLDGKAQFLLPNLNTPLNVFPDTHLRKRKLPDDDDDSGDEADAKSSVEEYGLSDSDSSDSSLKAMALWKIHLLHFKKL